MKTTLLACAVLFAIYTATAYALQIITQPLYLCIFAALTLSFVLIAYIKPEQH